MIRRISIYVFLVAFSVIPAASGEQQAASKVGKKPRIIVLGVNGAEWDFLRPLLIRGELPNLAKVVSNGVYGKLQTLSAPNCPKVYGTLYSGVAPEENGITGFVVGGITANTNMLKAEPVWSILSKRGVTVGMANVPATFPAMPVNGYMVSGMLTRGKGCEDGVLCAPKLSEVQGGDPVYPKSMVPELKANIGDFYIDCSRMPGAEDLAGKEDKVINEWLAGVQAIRDQQTKLFDYLLTNHPKDFTFLVQSCEDRVGHWLYPIQPHNVGYNPKINALRVDAFPNQYRAFDKVLGTVLKHVDQDTYLFIISDHGIKPLRTIGEAKHDASHGGTKSTTPVIAKHDYHDGDDVPGAIIAMGPGIRKNVELTGFSARVFDIVPTLLHLYGIPQPAPMKGRVLTELFDASAKTQTAEAHTH